MKRYLAREAQGFSFFVHSFRNAESEIKEAGYCFAFASTFSLLPLSILLGYLVAGKEWLLALSVGGLLLIVFSLIVLGGKKLNRAVKLLRSMEDGVLRELGRSRLAEDEI